MGSAPHPSPPQPVVAVVVTCDAPPDRLDEVLRALRGQDYPNLDVLVVDAGRRDPGARDPGARVREVLPAAEVLRADAGTRFGVAANIALDVVRGAGFYLFCHDDAAPDPGAVSAMVDAAERWGADIVGPKLVRWDDPRYLTQFGLTVDKVGVALPYVPRDERDQGQYDGLREVFAVPGGCTLVRAARFAEIGGFDEAMSAPGDDLSLSWRARLAGARVLVTSAARVRHAEACPGGAAGPTAGRPTTARVAARHRVRLLLTSYTPASLARIVPQALVLAVVEAAGALVTGRPGRARAALAAWPWNLWRLRSLVVARRQVAAFRSVRDREVRRHQVRGLVGPRLTLLRVGAGGGAGGAGRATQARRAAPVPVRGHMAADPKSWSPATVAVAACTAAVVAFGSRHLLTRRLPAVGELVPAGGGAADLLGAWWAGWRQVGVSAVGATPTLAGVLGLLGTVLGGNVQLARTLLVVGLVPLGIVGAHRLAAPTGSKPAQVAGAVAYAAVPLPYDALAAGRWSALAAYAAAPWMLGRLARASGVVPFGPAGRAGAGVVAGEAGGEVLVRHRLWKHAVATGAVTALAGVLVPQAPGLLAVMGLCLVAGSLLGGQFRGAGRVALATAGGAAVAALLLLPATADIVGTPAAGAAWLGADRGPEGLAATELLGLRTGTTAPAGPALVLLAAAAVALLVGRDWRLRWAGRGWAVAVGAWAVAWAHEQGRVTVRLPDAGVLLAPAGAGLALAVALGAAAVHHDVRGRSWRLGLRWLAVALGLAALAASTASAAVASLDGRWGMPGDDFARLLTFVDDEVAAGPSRVLWAGDAELLPGGDGWDLDGRVSYTVSTGAAVPGVTDLWPATSAAAPRLGDALRAAADGETARLGRRLAEAGVAYVAVPVRLAPSAAAPSGGPGDGPAGALIAALAEQLDLERVGVDRGLVLYRNAALGRPVPGGGAAGEGTPGDATGPARALVIAQAGLWLAAVAVVLRMRFGAGVAPAGPVEPVARRVPDRLADVPGTAARPAAPAAPAPAAPPEVPASAPPAAPASSAAGPAARAR